MIRAVVWKELREQGLIAVLLAVVGGALVAAGAAFGDPPSSGASPSNLVAYLGAARLLTLMLVVTGGMVCGGALFAAEREAGTMAFLEALPVARWPLWRAKVVAGLALTSGVVGGLVLVSAALGVTDGPFAARLAVYAVLAFVWGLLGSTLTRTTLGSVGAAIATATAASFLVLVPVVLFLSVPGTGVPRASGWAVYVTLMVLVPLVWSARRFTEPDRLRAADAVPLGAARGARPRAGRAAGAGWRALGWLALRQMALLAPVLSLFALAFGLVLLLPDTRGVVVWPALALMAGVVTGVTAFGDEQAHGRALFWGEQRLPLGRAWTVKVGAHLLLLLWLLFLALLPGLVRTQLTPALRFAHGHTVLAAVFQSRLFDELGAQGWKYLLVPAAYGFAAGHLCGLTFRKLVVACGVAAIAGGVAAVLWAPALLAGGLSHWQVWPPAALAVFTGRLVARGWAADRAHERGPALRLAGGAALAALVCAVGIGLRAVQLPDVPDGDEDLAFVAALPTYDENVGGREFRTAAERYARNAAAVTNGDLRAKVLIENRIEGALRGGWDAGDAELGEWLDRVFAEPVAVPGEAPWPVLVREAARHPVGVYEQPQLVGTAGTTAAALDNARRAAGALLARALQAQARGDHTAFPPAAEIVSKLARTVRRGGGLLPLSAAIEIERLLVATCERWLERYEGPAAGPKAVAALFAAADPPDPVDVRSHLLADRYVARMLMQAPAQWLAALLAPPNDPPERAAAEADLVALAWTVPWERERTRRLLGLTSDETAGELFRALGGRPGAGLLISRVRVTGEVVEVESQQRVSARALLMRLALRAHQIERGAHPEAAGELVARGYLPRLPLDPYSGDGRPLGYRLSPGETLRGTDRVVGTRKEEAPALAVAAGSAVVWSVGNDRTDQGGRNAPAGPRAADIVVIVPPAR